MPYLIIIPAALLIGWLATKTYQSMPPKNVSTVSGIDVIYQKVNGQIADVTVKQGNPNSANDAEFNPLFQTPLVWESPDKTHAAIQIPSDFELDDNNNRPVLSPNQLVWGRPRQV